MCYMNNNTHAEQALTPAAGTRFQDVPLKVALVKLRLAMPASRRPGRRREFCHLLTPPFHPY